MKNNITDMISSTHSITNTSDKYILVGNGSEMIAAYESKAEAVADIDNQVPSIEASKWAAVRVLAPGEQLERKLAAYRPRTAAEQTAQDKESAEGMAWINSLSGDQ
jgi:hypothetical protein